MSFLNTASVGATRPRTQKVVHRHQLLKDEAAELARAHRLRADLDKLLAGQPDLAQLLLKKLVHELAEALRPSLAKAAPVTRNRSDPGNPSRKRRGGAVGHAPV
jgi:hypothetical protein